MHVLLTHEEGLGPPELGATRDLLILTGMSVVTMATAPASDLQAGALFTLQSADPECNPVYGVSGPADEALAQAVEQGLQAQLCVVLSQDMAECGDSPAAGAALAAARLGLPVLNVRYPKHGHSAPDAWISDLATEVAAVALARPMPAAAMLVLTAPPRLLARVPVLMPPDVATHSLRDGPQTDRPAPRAHERDALAQGQITLTPVQLGTAPAADAADLAQWAQALVHTLHSRLSGSTMRCACCAPSLLPPISHSH